MGDQIKRLVLLVEIAFTSGTEIKSDYIEK